MPLSLNLLVKSVLVDVVVDVLVDRVKLDVHRGVLELGGMLELAHALSISRLSTG